MQIDRSNYEVWFIDWLDGNLNSLQVEELMLFMDQNQDLREEFNDLTPVDLASSGISFHHKEDLKKSPSDISPYQFDYLCAAYLENDLINIQQTELKEIANADPDKKKSFDLMQKTILAPVSISYKHKDLLLKRTTIQKVIQLSLIGLTAAAAIALIIITYSLLPYTTSLKINRSAHNLVYDSTLQRPSSVMKADRIIRDSIPEPVQKEIKNMSANTHKKDKIITNADIKVTLSDDSLSRKIENQEITVKKVPAYAEVDLRQEVVRNKLVASNAIVNIPEIEDERSDIGRFIAKTFRVKFLKEKTPSDTPITGLEIAEAGVAGLNKLFGWQIALDMKNDDNGQPKSVYFSSKILKVNAPVKKKEPQP
jgi:hypothetical protein